MIGAGILPMPFVYLLRRFQLLKVDLDIHQGSIRRNETTASTKEMIDQDDDVSTSSLLSWSLNGLFLFLHNLLFRPHLNMLLIYIVYDGKPTMASLLCGEKSFPFFLLNFPLILPCLFSSYHDTHNKLASFLFFLSYLYRELIAYIDFYEIIKRVIDETLKWAFWKMIFFTKLIW